MLDEQTVMIYPGAFDEVGLELIHHYFDVVLEIDKRETFTHLHVMPLLLQENEYYCRLIALKRLGFLHQEDLPL